MVYRVLADGIDIFGSDTESSLLSPSLETELNSAGSLDFTLPPDHPSYDDISLMQTEIDVYEDDELIFFGRPAEVSIDWNKQKKVSCEGALAYLNDAAIRPHKFEGALISDVFKYIIAQYNAQVAQNKQFIVGNITIVDRYVYTEFDYDICLSVLISTCIDSTGGYLFLRKEENGIYIDWLAEVPDVSDQPVQFASNMLDLNQDTKAEDICTVVLPIGGQVDGVNITIAPVNQGSDILEDSDAIAKYGRILKIQQWNDIVDPQALKDKATEWLAKQQEDDVTIETDAAELHYLDGSVGAYRIGQLVNVISGPHGVDKEYPILKMSMNLDSGTKKITLGTPPRKELTELSGITNSTGGGSSSGGGGGGGSTGVTDVLVNGSSVVSDHVAEISAVTPQQLADGLALKQDQLTPGTGISIDANNVISATGGGSSTNYGKFKCDVLFDTPTSSSGWGNPINICTKSVVEEYDVLVLTFGATQQETATILVADLLSNQNGKYYYLPTTNANGSNFHISGLQINSNNDLLFYVDVSGDYLYKVYGLKFENKLINRSDIYSEEERMIGRWTDGKPLYQKVVRGNFNGAYNTTVTIYYDDISSDIESVNKLEAYAMYQYGSDISSRGWFKNNYTVNNNINFLCSTSEAGRAINLGLMNPDWATMYDYYMIIQYTKTTDQPGSGVIPEDPQMVMMSDYYSEDEQVVGRWTDGKPLYQKTVIINNPSYGSSWTSISHGINNIDKVCLVEGVVKDSGSTYFINSYRPSINVGVILGVDQTNINYINNWLENITKIYVTLQYTKTTDAPGTGPTKGNLIYLPALYSEEEREVGVWTDGKPLYQKTIPVTLPSSDGVVCTFSANVDYMVSLHYHGLDTTNFYNADSSYGSTTFYYNKSNNSVYISGYQSWMPGDSGYFTFQYTKTTDQPGSGTWTPEGQLAHHYSTSEKIVGTWIDGSTVYERTWDFSANPISLPYDTWVNTTIQSSDGVSNIISAECLTSSFLVMDGNEIMVGAANYPVGICAKINHGRSLGYLTLQYTKSS